mgnify:CR=1 FL=1
MKQKKIKKLIEKYGQLDHNIMMLQKEQEVVKGQVEYAQLNGDIGQEDLKRLQVDVYTQQGKDLYFN